MTKQTKKKETIKDLRLKYPDKPDGCLKCKLFEGCKSYKIPSRLLHSGHGDKVVLIVCQNPGSEEDTTGEILVGKSGKLLQEYIHKYLVEFKVWGTNCVKCFSPLVYMKHIKPCSVFLADDLIQINPDKVIAMGKPAEKALTYLGVKYDSCVHPAYVLRGNSDVSIVECFSRVRNELLNKVLPIPVIDSTLQELYNTSLDVVGLDLEWNPENHKPFIVGSATKDKCVGVILNDDSIAQIKRVLNNPYITVVGHNMVEDVRHLLQYCTPKCKFIDTLILKRELAHGLPDGSLEFFADRYLAVEDYKHSNDPEFFTKVSPELLKRAAGDAWVPIKLWEKFQQDFSQEYKEMTPARELDMSMILPAAKMIYHGIGVDMGNLWKHRKEVTTKLVQTQEQIIQQYGINPRSPEQVLNKLVELGFQATNTKAETLKTIQHPFADLMLVYRDCDSQITKYLDPIPELVDVNNQIHCSLNIAGTVTGRLSSSNPNMQNIPPGLRDIFKSKFGKDGLLASLDAVQSELICLAYLSGSQYMISSYANGVDFHSIVTNQLGISRHSAKILNFAYVYGSSEKGLINQLIKAGIDPGQAPTIVKQYIGFMTQLGIAPYQQKVLDDAYKNGYVSSVYGRRSYKLASTEVINYPIQSFSGDLNKMRIVELERLLREEHLLSHVWLEFHDAAELDIYKPELDKVQKLIKLINTTIPDVLGRGIVVELPLEFKIHGTHWK